MSVCGQVAGPTADRVFASARQVSPAGKVLRVLMDPKGRAISLISAVTEHRGRLYFGHLSHDYVSYLDLQGLG